MRSKSFEQECTEKEEFFGTKYCVSNISQELLSKMKNPKCQINNKKIDLPPKNNLIPKNFDLLAKDE